MFNSSFQPAISFIRFNILKSLTDLKFITSILLVYSSFLFAYLFLFVRLSSFLSLASFFYILVSLLLSISLSYFLFWSIPLSPFISLVIYVFLSVLFVSFSFVRSSVLFSYSCTRSMTGDINSLPSTLFELHLRAAHLIFINVSWQHVQVLKTIVPDVKDISVPKFRLVWL
jgi:hypothetical protein